MITDFYRLDIIDITLHQSGTRGSPPFVSHRLEGTF
jgi:hypothetical protein